MRLMIGGRMSLAEGLKRQAGDPLQRMDDLPLTIEKKPTNP
jgi:hypothetical protein